MSSVTTKLIEAMHATLLDVERTPGFAALEIERTAEQAGACEDSPKP
jgi:hypothetical protein